MSDLVNIKDFSGSSVTVLTDEVTHGTFGTGQVQVFKQMDGTPNSTNMAVVDAAGNVAVKQLDVTASGTLAAANQTVSITPNGAGTVYIQTTGAYTVTIVMEGTIDGTNWFGLSCQTPSGILQTILINGSNNGSVRTAGLTSFRVRASAYTSGTATITMRASAATNNVTLDAPLASGQNLIGAVNVQSIWTAGTAIGGNPIRVGGTARTANPAAVLDNQTSNVMTDKMGRLVTVTSHVRDLVSVQATTIASSTTATTVVNASGSVTVFADITHIDVSNSSATGTLVTLSDGTISQNFYVPAGGNFVCDYAPPLKATTANTAWTLTCGTSVASVYCNAIYVKNL